jgi:2-oxoglutarate ferredoxin oxidoreductase subunit delta
MEDSYTSGCLEGKDAQGSADDNANTRKKTYTPRIFKDWCKSCGICVAFCPKGVIGKDETGAPEILHPDRCIGCRFCELHCPDFAISVREEKATERKGLNGVKT